MAKKVYAVKKGFDFDNNVEIKNKIVQTWSECLKLVKGVKGAEYKSFTLVTEAEEYLNQTKSLLKKGEDDYPLDQYHAYVDGSFNQSSGLFSYALVVVKDDVIVHIENGAADNNEQQSIRQIAGELLGSIRAAKYAAENSIKDIVILHDYVGVCYHATGFWERKEKSSQKYYNDINKIIRDNDLSITFVKVDSHTGDLFNEIVDEFAKKAVDIPVTGETKKYLKNKNIMVKSHIIKEKMFEIVGEETSQKIVILDEMEEMETSESKNNNFELEKVIMNLKNHIINEDDKAAEDYIKALEEDTKNKLLYILIKNYKI